MTTKKLSINEMMWAHTVGRQVARVYLEYNHPELEPDELNDLLAVVDERVVNKQTATNYDPNRNKFVAAMWLCGASFRQLALAYNVTHETMLRARDKALGGVKVVRLTEPPIEMGRVLVMRKFCDELSAKSKDIVTSLDYMSIAKILHNLPTTSEEEDHSPYPTAPTTNIVEQPATVEPKQSAPKDAFSPEGFDFSILDRT